MAIDKHFDGNKEVQSDAAMNKSQSVGKKMTCNDFEEQIHQYFSDPDFDWQLKEKIDEHYFGCESCFEVYQVAKIMADPEVKKATIEKLKEKGSAMKTVGKGLGVLLLSGGLVASGAIDSIVNRFTKFNTSNLTKSSYSVSEVYAAEAAPVPETTFAEDADRFVKHLLGREYTKMIKDADGNPVLKVEVKYLGKSPDKDYPVDVPQRWLDYGVDYYNVTYTNLTDEPITFVEVVSWGEKGELVSKRTASAKDIATSWGTNILKPYGNLKKSNRWISSTIESDKNYKDFRIHYNGRDINFLETMTYRR